MNEPNIPHLDQYAGIWAMHEPAFMSSLEQVRGMDLLAHIRAIQDRSAAMGAPERSKEPAYSVTSDGVAVIDFVGAMTKYGSSLSSFPGTLGMRRRIRQAVADDEVKAIVLRIDSPGGSTAGTSDLAETVAAANAKKPVTAFIEDLGASAAYWVASQAGRVVANAGALVGSIGTYAVIYDYSQMYAKEGIKAYVVRAGKFKGTGITGTEVSAEQLAEFQRTVDRINSLFTSSVGKGRSLNAEQMQELADGRVHIAADALALGLIDAVGTLDETVASARAGKRSSARERALSKENLAMEETKAGPAPVAERKPASIAELKAKFPKASAEFRESCLERGLTLAEATDAYLAKTQEDLDQANARVASTQQELEKTKAASNRPGVDPVLPSKGQSQAADTAGSATDRWNEAIAAKVKAGMKRDRAISAVVKADPDLHAAYLAEHNEANGRRS